MMRLSYRYHHHCIARFLDSEFEHYIEEALKIENVAFVIGNGKLFGKRKLRGDVGNIIVHYSIRITTTTTNTPK